MPDRGDGRDRARRRGDEDAVQGPDRTEARGQAEGGKDDLRIVRFNIQLSCRDGSILIDEESGFVRTPVHRNGRFSDVQVGSTDTVLIRGKAKGRAIRGRLRVKDRLGRGVRCDSRWVKFSARP